MSDKFEWNLNPDNSDLQRYLNMDLNEAAAGGEQEPEGAVGPAPRAEAANAEPPAAPTEEANAALPESAAEAANPAEDNNEQPNQGDPILDPADAGEDPEFYLNSGMEGNSLPNDEIWKKFDLYEGLTNRGLIDPLNDTYDDMPWLNHMALPLRSDAREIRNHDCMWAGHCISEKHDSNNPNNPNRVNYFPLTPPSFPRSEDTELMALTTPDGPAFADRPSTRRNVVVAPTHARSVLLPSRVVNSTTASRRSASVRSHTVTTSFRKQRSRTLDSGGDSPRPETPQSLTDNEDLNLDLADMKAVEDLVADSFGYNFMNDIVPNIGNEASGYDFGANTFDRNQQGNNSNASSSAAPSRGAGNRARRNVARQEVPVSRHYTDHSFFSDHCYHLSKNARMDNLGVQTPSDSGARRSMSAGPTWSPASGDIVVIQKISSEEEIDVETVYGDFRKPNSRSSSTGSGLPTNPSPSDRQQIQLSVATAISKKEGRRQNPRAGTAAQRRNSAAGAQGRGNAAGAQGRGNAAGAQGRNNTTATQGRGNAAGAQGRNNTTATQGRGNAAGAQGRNNTTATQGRGNAAGAQGRNNTTAAQGRSNAAGAQAGDSGTNSRVATGTKRRLNARGETRRNAGTERNPNTDETDESENRGGKRRRYENDNDNAPRAGRSRTRKTGRNSGRSTGSSDSEVDSVERRSIHNSMERQRRIDLRNSFEELRKLIPKTASNEKAAKVLILCSGADYCRALTLEDLELIEKKAELRRKQELLLARVSQLRRSLAARR